MLCKLTRVMFSDLGGESHIANDTRVERGKIESTRLMTESSIMKPRGTGLKYLRALEVDV